MPESRSRQRSAGKPRLKRTPTLTFKPDTGVRTGERVDEILRELPPVADEPTTPDELGFDA